MKKVLFLLMLSAFVLTAAEPAAVAQQKSPAGEKKAAAEKNKQAVKKKKKKINYYPNLKVPALENPQSWTMVVVPDIQGYVSKETNHGILNMMMAWMVTNKKVLNIRQVLFTGDLVDWNQEGRLLPDRKELTGKEQWEATSKLISRLDGRLPYILCTGNHDYGIQAGENRDTNFNEFFKINRNPLSREQLVECGFNGSGIKTMENAIYEFTAPHPDCRKFLVVTLQWVPTAEQLEWAKKIFNEPRFANHFGIVLTHSYMHANGELITKTWKEIEQVNGLPGAEVYHRLVKQTSNIRLVVCGHVCGVENWEKSVGYTESVNGAGKKVAQMVFNTQAIGKQGKRHNGGDGWLRLLEFMPDKKTIKARTFSPFFAASPSTCHLAWKTDARNEFTFTIE